MNILEYAMAKKLFGGSGGATAYHRTSADELPTDAVDGSLAVVESDSILGTWVWNETLSAYPQGEFDVPIKFISGANLAGINARYEYTNLFYDGQELVYIGGEAELEVTAYYNGWDQEIFKTIEILAEPTDTAFIAWLKANAVKQGGGHTLYSRENGEWVSKGEI